MRRRTGIRPARHYLLIGTARWGTALADSDSLSIARGFALLARTAGLIGHRAEESATPLGMRLWKESRAGLSGLATASRRISLELRYLEVIYFELRSLWRYFGTEKAGF